jgi:hypothetical protein
VGAIFVEGICNSCFHGDGCCRKRIPGYFETHECTTHFQVNRAGIRTSDFGLPGYHYGDGAGVSCADVAFGSSLLSLRCTQAIFSSNAVWDHDRNKSEMATSRSSRMLPTSNDPGAATNFQSIGARCNFVPARRGGLTQEHPSPVPASMTCDGPESAPSSSPECASGCAPASWETPSQTCGTPCSRSRTPP